MDKLRAIQYLVAAADGASLSAAARRHDVSVAAVAKLVGALEATLGIALIERSRRGVTLTAAGAAFVDGCRPALQQLDDTEQLAAAATQRASGTVVVGVQTPIAQEILTPALPRFLALHPDVQLDVRTFLSVEPARDAGFDVMLMMGWPQRIEHLVHRAIGATSFVVAASPGYWAAHGMPRHPAELERHNCLCIRSNRGLVMDVWKFRRGDEHVAVTTRGWLIADNGHRDMVRDLALAGAGVARLIDWHQRPGREIPRGLLVQAFADWTLEEVPPVNLLYPPSVRRIPRVRLFIDWVVQLFADVERERRRPQPASPMPAWVGEQRSRVSAVRAGAS